MKNLLLIGDSIRMGYDKSVKLSLEGKANVIFPTDNCRFASFVQRYLHEYCGSIKGEDIELWGDPDRLLETCSVKDFLQIVEKYAKEYVSACSKIAKERERFIKELTKFKFLNVYPSEANYVLCEVKKPYTAKSLCLELWTRANCLVKDCSSKKGFDNGQFIRLAVKSEKDDNELLEALKSL